METMKHLWILIFGLILVLNHSPLVCGESEEAGEEDYHDDGASDTQPSISSEPVNLTLERGQDFKLECDGETGSLSLMWFRQKPGQPQREILWIEVKYTTDPRFEFEEHSLSLKNITEEDTGKYICQIGPNTTLTHVVNVKGPSRVKFNEKAVSATEKTEAVLKCHVEGFPVPKIEWVKEGHSSIPTDTEISEDYGWSFLKFRSVGAHHKGRYFCHAENPEGKASASVDLVVRHTPEIHVTHDALHSAVGHHLELTCHINAFPKAKVDWLFSRNGTFHRLETNNPRYSAHTDEDKYILHISKVAEDDFGTFSCHASNEIGTSVGKIVLTRAPSQPMLLRSAWGKDYMSYNLVWTIESSSPIEEYLLRFKKGDGNWTDLQAKGMQDPKKKNTYIVNYVFEKLEPAKYEAQLAAKNANGWSNMSRVYDFKMNGNRYQSSVAESAKAARGGGTRLVSSWFFSSMALPVAIFGANSCRWQ